MNSDKYQVKFERATRGLPGPVNLLKSISGHSYVRFYGPKDPQKSRTTCSVSDLEPRVYRVGDTLTDTQVDEIVHEATAYNVTVTVCPNR